MQDFGHLSVSSLAAVFLVVPEREVHVAGRLKAPGQEQLGGFEQADGAALHVECATAPDESVGDPAGKWRVGPILVGPLLYRDDVDMRHQQDRLDQRDGPLPPEQQGVATDVFALKSLVDRREFGFEEGLECHERRRVGCRGWFGSDRGKPEGLREPLCVSGSRLESKRPRYGHLARREEEGTGIDRENGRGSDQAPEDGPQDSAASGSDRPSIEYDRRGLITRNLVPNPSALIPAKANHQPPPCERSESVLQGTGKSVDPAA